MKSYFRFLSRNKLYTLINIAGLVVSLMFIILIGDYTWRQYRIDSWHKNADRICIIANQYNYELSSDAAKGIQDMCPEVEQRCSVLSGSGKIKYGNKEVKNDEKEKNIIMVADSNFFQFFDFELLQGNRQTALNAPDKCVITERVAKRLFGNKNPIGQSIQIVGHTYGIEDWPGRDYDSTLVYTISAVAKDFDRTVLPNETGVIASMERCSKISDVSYDYISKAASWGANFVLTFFMLRPDMTLDGKRKTIEDFINKSYPYVVDEKKKIDIIPLEELMYASQNSGQMLLKGDKTRVRILLAAVLAILFFAISNYINLTVANTGFRSKEMATRKLFGSSQYRISLKLIVESTLMVAVSFAIGLVLAFSFQEDAINLFEGKIALANDICIGSVSLCIAFILLLGVVSGMVPSWQLSHYQPIDIVKGNFRFHSKMVLGKIFIILQNVITVTMLTAALVIWLQINHLIHAPIGFNTENLLEVRCSEGKGEVIRNQLEKYPFIESIGSNDALIHPNSCFAYEAIRGDRHFLVYTSIMDRTTFDLLGLKIEKDNGIANGYYMNREALRQLDCTEDSREFDLGDGFPARPIAGVLSDFHFGTVLDPVEPFGIQILDGYSMQQDFLVKTNGDKKAKIILMEELGKLGAERVWSLEETIKEAFEDEQKTLRIVSLFTLIAIVISVMGFVGMSLFFIRQRQKEVGLRKIMGGTSREVTLLMLRTFCAPLLVSFVIAVPISYYIMNEWLSNFSYRISLSPWIFAAMCAFALLVAVLSVGFQIVKAVRTNPVESIKTE